MFHPILSYLRRSCTTAWKKASTYTNDLYDGCVHTSKLLPLILKYVLRRFSFKPFGGSVTTIFKQEKQVQNSARKEFFFVYLSKIVVICQLENYWLDLLLTIIENRDGLLRFFPIVFPNFSQSLIVNGNFGTSTNYLLMLHSPKELLLTKNNKIKQKQI